LNINDNPYIVNYQKKDKRQVFQGISLLKKDKNFDIFNLVEQLFPPVDPEVFYSGKLAILKKCKFDFMKRLSLMLGFLFKK
jgi:hypothetical protein